MKTGTVKLGTDKSDILSPKYDELGFGTGCAAKEEKGYQ
jgi:hypothetical protein